MLGVGKANAVDPMQSKAPVVTEAVAPILSVPTVFIVSARQFTVFLTFRTITKNKDFLSF